MYLSLSLSLSLSTLLCVVIKYDYDGDPAGEADNKLVAIRIIVMWFVRNELILLIRKLTSRS